MTKLTAVLLGGAAAMLTFNPAQAVPAARVTQPTAQSYADLLQPVPNAVAALQADEAARVQQPARFELARFHHHHHHGFYGGGPRFGFGFYGGPYYGGPYYDYGYEGPPVVYGAPAPAGGGDVAYCAQRYHSYDPQSGTYLGFDGRRHPCP
ncbi:MAG TPA: BA14K family protein [Pseudolabrys sp.]|nr:BA14K family protein [Pseudolabrys sp.]